MNLNEARRKIRKPYDPWLLNTYGINITFSEPVKKGTVAIGRVFRAWEGHRNSLDKNRIARELRKAFKKYGLPLTPIATVSTEAPGNRWLITDGSKKYGIRKTEGRLSIFDESKLASAGWRNGMKNQYIFNRVRGRSLKQAQPISSQSEPGIRWVSR
jgi:hypothetical protein